MEKGAKALHGDIAQNNREVVLQGFRDNKFQVLVATDVAARGLDISGVELVIQCEPPKDPESVHSSLGTNRTRWSDWNLRDTAHAEKRVGYSEYRAKRWLPIRANRTAATGGDGESSGKNCLRKSSSCAQRCVTLHASGERFVRGRR